nr:retrovirus-related Pol polyprotein from transposon TNT 1-94 [Tanacetum cinerariifolium]
MNYLEEQTDGEAMINSIKNGDQSFPCVTQVSIVGTSLTGQPPLKDKSMCNKTAKDLWDTLARHMLGSEYGEQDRKAAILYEYETFKAIEGELLLDTYIHYLQVINDLKKCGYPKDNCELNFKFLNNLQPGWKQYPIMMRLYKNLMDINIDALYNILKQNQGDVNNAMGLKKKIVVVTSDPLALIVEKTKVSKRKEKVVVSLDSDGSDDELKKITALLAKAFNRKKFYSKPTNNNLRTSSASNSANKKQEFVKSDDKKEEKQVEEKKRDMSKVKCYNCKKEGHFAKDCKKAKVKDYEYYKTKMLLANKDKDEQVILDEDHPWMESSSDSDQEINANMVFMAHIKKVLSDLEASSSSSDDKIAEIKVFIEKNADLLAQTNGLQEQLKVKHVVIDTHAECFENPSYFCKSKDLRPTLYDERVIYLGYTLMFLTHSNEALEIEKFKRARENKIEFAYDYGNLNASYVNEKINFLDDYFQEIINPDFDKIDSPFQQTSSLKPYVPTVILERIIIDLEDEVRYCRKDLMLCNNSHLRDTRSAFACNNARNAYCNATMNAYDDVNDLFVFEDESLGKSQVSKMPFRKKPHASLNMHSRSKLNTSLPRNVFKWLPKMKSLAEPIAKWIPRIVQICLWIIDSGCSKHITGNRALLTNFVEKFIGTVRFGNNDFAVIDDYGDVVIGSMTIKRVYYVEGLGHNLFSVGQFCDKGLKVSFRKSSCFVRNEHGVDLLTDDRSLNLYTIALNEIALNSSSCLLAKASSSQSWLWRQCLSHLNFATINNFVKNNLVRGLPKMKFKKDHLCSACKQRKIHQKHHKSATDFASNKPLYLLHMNLYGPMHVESINRKRYVLVFVDDFSRYTWVFFLHSKDEAFEVLISFIKKTQVNLQLQVQRVRTDNGTEFKNKTLAKPFNEVGISQQFFAARTPQQNGVMERRNRTLVEAAKTMLTFANLPLFLWAEAIATACFTQNRLIIHKHFDKTPYELINKRKPNIKFFHVFGCRCYLLIDYDDVGKLKAKGDIRVFVVYSKDFDAFRVYNKQTRKIHESVNVNFDEISKMASKQFSLKPEEVYVAQPPGFVSKQYLNHVCAFDKALYDLKQAPQAWYDVLSKFLIDSGFQKGDKLVCWSSKKQNYVSISTAESEYVVVSGCCAQVLWMRTQLTDYGFFYDKVP